MLGGLFTLAATVAVERPAGHRPGERITPRSQPGTDMTIYSPKLHGLYDGKFRLSCGRTYVVGGLSDKEGWEHMDNAGTNSKLAEGTVEIDVDEIKNTGTFIAKLKLPEGLFEMTLDRFTEAWPARTAASPR